MPYVETPLFPIEAPVSYWLGLDLGQAADFTALAVVERRGAAGDNEAELHVRALRRYELGTSYPSIVDDVVKRLEANPLPPRSRGREIPGKPTLGVDATGVGAPVVDIFRRQRALRAHLRPILITGGDKVTREGGVTRVPKRDLVGAVQVPLQNGRLKISAALPEAATLTSELQNFQVKISESAHDSYGSWREGTHDDLVLALAIALWLCSGKPAGPSALGPRRAPRGWADVRYW